MISNFFEILSLRLRGRFNFQLSESFVLQMFCLIVWIVKNCTTEKRSWSFFRFIHRDKYKSRIRIKTKSSMTSGWRAYDIDQLVNKVHNFLNNTSRPFYGSSSWNMYVIVRLGHETEYAGYRKAPEARWNSELNFQPRNRASLTTNEVMLSNFDNG